MATDDSGTPVTEALDGIRAGDDAAKDRLIELIYDDLRQNAARLMKRERAGHTLAPTAVVHESLMRIMDTQVLERFENRRHLLAAATVALQRVLIDHARARGTQKRGGAFKRVDMEHVTDSAASPEETPSPPEVNTVSETEHLDRLLDWYDEKGLDIIALDEALAELKELEKRWADVILLRFFGGNTIEQTADILSVSPRTVTQDWNQARAWLKVRLGDRFNVEVDTSATS